jgi:peptide/nickel transport system substrate-binding protein
MANPSCLNRRQLLPLLLSPRAVSGQGPARRGGSLTVALRSDIKTFLPLAAIDDPTRTVLSLCHSGLVRTNGETQKLEGVLAESWRLRDGGRRITVRLREGLRFSDGRPLTSADVVFTMQAHLDERAASPQRDLLAPGGRPLEARALDVRTIELLLAAPSALSERLLDELAILPKHALEERLRAGTLASAWGVDARPETLVSSGPFRIAAYRPGQSVTLERNPHYWRTGGDGNRLPYLERVAFVFTSGEDAQLARLIAGECDLVMNLGAANTSLLEKYSQQRNLQLTDLGASLDSVSLLFQLGGERERASPALRDERVRAAIARVVDRESIVRLVYRGRALPMTSHVSPGRRYWHNDKIARTRATAAIVRAELAKSGYRYDAEGMLLGRDGARIQLTLIVNSSNPAYAQIATIVAADLKQIGIGVQVSPLEFRSFVDRVMTKRDFDLAVMPLRSSAADPMSDMNILLSSGPMHLWNPAQKSPATQWEAEIDRLMRQQAATADPAARKRSFDRVQAIMAEQNPMIPLVSPHTLVASRKGLGNFRPSVLPNAALWNADELYWAAPPSPR